MCEKQEPEYTLSMKLTKSFESYLQEHFEEVMVIDERGDGHHVEIIAIDKKFAPMGRLERSRHVFKILDGFLKTVHASTIRAFTPEQWAKKKDTFSPTQYVHIR